MDIKLVTKLLVVKTQEAVEKAFIGEIDSPKQAKAPKLDFGYL